MGQPNRRAHRAQRNRPNRKPFVRRPAEPEATSAEAEATSAMPTVPVSEDPLAPWSRLGTLPWLSGNDLLKLHCVVANAIEASAHFELEQMVWDSLAEDLDDDEHSWLVTAQHLDHWLLYANVHTPPGEPSILAEMAEATSFDGLAAVASALGAMDRSVLARFEVVGLPAPGLVSVRHLHRDGASAQSAVVALPYTYGAVSLGAGLVGRVWPGEGGGLRFAPDLLVFPTPPRFHLNHPEADGAAWLQLWYRCGCRGASFERQVGSSPFAHTPQAEAPALH